MTPQNFLDDLVAFGYEDTDINVKMRALNFALQKVASRKPWPWMEKVASLSFDGTNPYPTSQPVDLRQTLRMIDTSSGKRVRYKPVDEIENEFGASLLTSGTAQFYYFEGTQLRVWPVPPAQSLRLRYLRIHPTVGQSDPETAILVPVTGHEAVLFRLVMRMADIEDDDEIAARMDPLFEREMADLTEVLAVQQYDTNDHVSVIDDDDFNYDL